MSRELVMRRAREDDLPAIVVMLAQDQIGHADNPGLPLDPAYLEAFRAIDGSPDQLLMVAEFEERIVGTMQLTFIPGLLMHGAWRGQIEAVRIDSSVRGQGLGSRMIDWAVERCRERDCKLVQLTSNNARTDAHRFYERLGWSKSHAGFKLMLDQGDK
jgi:GNAT superfamily N-acetyltransferase